MGPRKGNEWRRMKEKTYGSQPSDKEVGACVSISVTRMEIMNPCGTTCHLFFCDSGITTTDHLGMSSQFSQIFYYS